MTGRNGAVSTGAVVRRLKLGRALRELREAAGFSVETAAPRLEWSSSKLSRIEKGQQGVDVHGVKSMLDLYDAGDRWEEILDLCRQTRVKGWWRTHGFNDQGYVPLENEASSVREVAIGHVPGLLQTEAYARAIFEVEARPLPSERIAQELAVRMHRQRRLISAEAPLELVAILDEAVLHREFGGPEVMVAQRAHLLAVARLPTVTLQVLPFRGPHPAVSAGFILLGFGALGVPDMVYVEHSAGSLHIDKVADVQLATLAFDRLRPLALDPDDSVALIERVIAQNK